MYHIPIPVFENPLLKVVIYSLILGNGWILEVYSYKEVVYVSKYCASWCNLCKLLLTMYTA